MTRPFSTGERLRSLENPIRVGIVGAGAMGRGLAYQCSITPGMRCVALVDIRPERAADCASMLGVDATWCRDAREIDEAIGLGRLAIGDSAQAVAEAGSVDVFLESSSGIESALGPALSAARSGKHLVLMNAELDLAFGPLLRREAEAAGAVMASCDGDQHGVIKRLVDEVTLWGFDLVMAGNIKGFLDRQANPTSIVPEADKRNLDYAMATAYTDGTKLSIEMALVANALGLRTAVPGMYGPSARHVSEALDLFDLDALRAGPAPVVDYLLSAEPGGGVFVIGYGDHPYQRSMMQYYKMGAGPYYVFYRPYHLCHVEAMDAIARAVLDGASLLAPSAMRADVIAYAKRDLAAGEVLDGVGGYACYGQVENLDEEPEPGLPICLAHGVRLLHPVSRDARISLSDVEDPDAIPGFAAYRESRSIVRLG